MKIKLIFLFFFLCVGGKTYAEHLAGGTMAYEYLGRDSFENIYKFTLKLYVDCNKSNISFDQESIIAIYTESDLELPYEKHTAKLQDIRNVRLKELSPNFSVIGQSPCIQEGIYSFEAGLPVTGDSYFITYQRCCRTSTNANIENLIETGSTYTIELTLRSQNVHNNSPTIEKYPPIFACVGEEMNYQLNLQDKDNDQIFYSFCAPLIGSDPSEPLPDPPVAPPYDPLLFNAPIYTSDQPVAGEPIISIDPSTGIISGVPQSVGNFLIGICVEDYRNGRLLSSTQFEFIIQVIPSDLKVEPPPIITTDHGITPNNDGLNDFLVFKNLEQFPENELIIFNRWGDTVYKAKPYQNDWGGTNRDTQEVLPEGTYYYMLRLDIPNGKYRSGSVSIFKNEN